MKLTIVIPAYNEERTLEKIFEKVQKVNINKEIIIVNDFSCDKTSQIAEEIKQKNNNVKVLHHKFNQGKGAALRTGFKAAEGDYVIVQDADLEYNPNDYHKLIQAIKAKKGDVIYGSRFLNNRKENMTKSHELGNEALTLITNLLYRCRLTDMETCYKLFPRELIQSIEYKSNRFNFEPEITAKVLKMGKKIYEVPIAYKGRNWEEGKHISWKDGFAAIATLIKYRFTD